MLHLLAILLLLVAAGACLYHVVLALLGLWIRPRAQMPSDRANHSFAVVIPAHDEENGLADTLRSCAALDYPRDRVTVFVIADNCTDATAEVARAAEAVCLERHDATRRGKGHALEWALPQVLESGVDAVLVLDADCRVDRHALRVFDCCLGEGTPVLQAAVVPAGADASAISFAVAVAAVLENDLFYRPKDRLGLAVFLRGTGMVLAAEVLRNEPWRARSVVEDKEYTLRLLRAGRGVRFVDEVRVHCEPPPDLGQLGVQRRRWTAGTFRFGKRRALRLMAEGLVRGRFGLCDAGWTLLIQVKAVLMMELLAAVLAAAATWWQEPDALSAALLAVCGGVVLLYGLYAALGAAALGLTRRRLALMLRLPLVVGHLVGIFVGGVFGADAWVPAVRRRKEQRC